MFLAVVFVQSYKARSLVENEDVVGAAPTGDTQTTSEWSTILLPTKVAYIRDLTVHLWAIQTDLSVDHDAQIIGHNRITLI